MEGIPSVKRNCSIMLSATVNSSTAGTSRSARPDLSQRLRNISLTEQTASHKSSARTSSSPMTPNDTSTATSELWKLPIGEFAGKYGAMRSPALIGVVPVSKSERFSISPRSTPAQIAVLPLKVPASERSLEETVLDVSCAKPSFAFAAASPATALSLCWVSTACPAALFSIERLYPCRTNAAP